MRTRVLADGCLLVGLVAVEVRQDMPPDAPVPILVVVLRYADGSELLRVADEDGITPWVTTAYAGEGAGKALRAAVDARRAERREGGASPLPLGS